MFYLMEKYAYLLLWKRKYLHNKDAILLLQSELLWFCYVLG